MIVIAIGTPNANALRIDMTNSESKFARGRTSGSDMTLLLGAPRATARPQDERSIACSDQGSGRLFNAGNAEGLWLTTG